MKKEETFKFNFDTSKTNSVRRAIDERAIFATQGTYDVKVSDVNCKWGTLKSIWSYDAIYASLDRIEDTLQYINSMELRTESIKKQRSAFDFLDFLNNMYIVINCIKTLGHVFDVSADEYKKIETSTDCFSQLGLTGQGNDEKFFSYIRSLTAVHPNETGRHPEYHGYGKIHYSPFVVWSCNLWNIETDISVHIYTSEEHADSQVLHLHISSFEKYLEKWIDFIDIIVEAIKQYNENKVSEYVNTSIESADKFNSYSDYIRNLKRELICRIGDYTDYLLEDYADVFELTLSDDKNNRKFVLYKNAIQYSLKFLHERLQHMDKDECTNTGIYYADNHCDTQLYIEMWNPRYIGSQIGEYGYELEKIHYIDDSGSYNEQYARELLETIKPLVNRYVVFTNTEPAFETKVLISMALYFESFEYKNVLNRNIPNSLEYRENLLSNEEWSDLISNNKVVDTEESPLRIFMKKHDLL